MPTSKVILLNGPPRCGKDTAGQILAHEFRGKCYSFAKALKDATHSLYGLTDNINYPDGVKHDSFESIKDKPLQDFMGLTPRQAYIKVAEQAIKPAFGQDFFCRMLARKLADRSGMSIITDLGFIHEVWPIAETKGRANVLLIRIMNRGNFLNDSRSYIETDVVQCLEISNNTTIDDFKAKLLKYTAEWANMVNDQCETVSKQV